MKYFLFVLGNLIAVAGYTQEAPTVFKMGEHEALYSEIALSHPTMLLAACDNDMDKAYIVWTKVLRELEKEAQAADLDLNGVKMWINFFWAADGSVDHITFFPKPNSRNLDYEEVRHFLMVVKDKLSLDLKDKAIETGIAHYGSASFPTHYQYHRAEGN